MNEPKSNSTSRVSKLMALMDRREYAPAYDGLNWELSSLAVSAPPEERRLLEVLSGECLAAMGHSNEALALCEPHAAALQMGQEHALYGRACYAIALANYYLGRMDMASQYADFSHFAFLRADEKLGVVKALNWSGNVLFYQGEYSQATAKYRECVRIAAEHSMHRWMAGATLNLALTSALTGHLQEAASYLDTNAPVVAEYCDGVAAVRNLLVRAFVSVQARAFAEARTVLSEVEARVCELKQIREQGAWCEYMGELELGCGNLQAAEVHLLHGIELASGESRDESVIGQSHRLLAEVRLAQGDPNGTIAEGKTALESIQKVGERFEEGVVYRVLAEARVALGQDAEARADFKQSISILRTIGARLEWAKSCLSAGRSAVFSRRERLTYLIEAERLFSDIGIEYWNGLTRDLLKQVMQERDEEMQTRASVQPVASSYLFITADPVTLQTLRLAERYARTDIAILITGETGVGKDQLARYIHSISPRHERPFVPIDLNTIPESLLESALFGHSKGSYTGAAGKKMGLLESANGGTVFFNEIGNLPLTFQARLLEVLDRRQVRPLGDTKAVSLDIRFLAATNTDLEDAVACGKFREDLYYRFAEAPLHLHPLRQRRADILPLIRHFFAELGLSEAELALIDRQLWVDRAHNGHWAGNVRRLRSFVRQLAAVAERPSDPDFPKWAERLLEKLDTISEPNVGAGVSRESLAQTLMRNGWNQRATARVLGITEGGVRHLMRRFGISRPEFA